MGQTNMRSTQLSLISAREDGFSLIELLLYVAIVSALLLSIVGFYAITLDARVKNQAIDEVNQQGVYAMDQITQSIRNSTSITLPTSAGSGPLLTLVEPTSLLSPTSYSLSGGVLQVQEGLNSPVSLTNSHVTINSFTAKNLSRPGTNGIIQVSFVVSINNATGRSAYDYSQTFTSSAEVAW